MKIDNPMWSGFEGQTIYLDSNIVIYGIEGPHRWSEATDALLQSVDQGLFRAVTSELAIAEVLVRPIASRDVELKNKYEELLAADSSIEVVAIDREVLSQAAHLRATLKVKLFDAIHVATARSAGCDYFLTQDERLGKALGSELKWLSLSEVSKS